MQDVQSFCNNLLFAAPRGLIGLRAQQQDKAAAEGMFAQQSNTHSTFDVKTWQQLKINMYYCKT
jgi:hypothetical protein